MGPFLVTEMDCVGEYPAHRHESLEGALRHRDALRMTVDHRRIGYRVLDADEGERGEAEWCVECGEVGTFGSECADCGAA